jgi:hypothetical protein
MIRSDQLPRFLWRLARNSICAFQSVKRILFPSSKLVAQFGTGDAAYAWAVFYAHFERLHKAGFPSAGSILEVGPGRNIGTSLIWYSMAVDSRRPNASIALWHVVSNANVDADLWRDCAGSLLRSQPKYFVLPEGAKVVLQRIAVGSLAYPVVIDFLETGLVPRFPAAILASAIMISAISSLFSGLTLDTLTLGQREIKRIAYFGYNGVQVTRARPRERRREKATS